MPLSLRKNIILNLRWHRRIGLSMVVFVIFLTLTGILLNHSPSFGLSKQTIRSTWLMDWYGFETQSLTGFRLETSSATDRNIEEKWLSHPGGNDLFLNEEPVANCTAPLLGGGQIAGPNNQTLLLALCQNELIILTQQGELVDKLDTVTGLPENTTALQVLEEEILILNTSNNNPNTFSVNIDTLEINPSKINVETWSTPSPLPPELVEQLQLTANLPGISLETLILDLHSGRFFGSAGGFFVDLIGLLICLLALTGLWAWYSHKKLKKLGG